MTVSWRGSYQFSHYTGIPFKIDILLFPAFDNAEWVLLGNHGWDNLNSEMQAMFVAQGPSFKKSTEIRPFHNIDLYNLMCAMVGVDPAPNNGTWVRLIGLLFYNRSIQFFRVSPGRFASFVGIPTG